MFEVGKKEKHQIIVEMNRWTSKLEVLVDGKAVEKRYLVWIGKKECSFEVGDKEKHDISLHLKLPVATGLGRQIPCDIFVDGVLTKTRHL